MKKLSDFLPLTVDATAIRATIDRALADAGLDPRSGAIGGAIGDLVRSATHPWLHGSNATAPTAARGSDDDTVVDVVARTVGTAADAPTPAAERRDADVADAPPVGRAPPRSAGIVRARRRYDVHVPVRLAAPPPVLVMLHGCTQSAADFAAGTRMNDLADAHGVVVVYPEQSADANASRCWSWFQPGDQRRDAGEPEIVAAIVDDVVARHGGDAARVWVAGLSAGAAMAVILGQTHPERFAAVGAHSGLPYRSAHDVASALAAMKGRAPGGGAPHVATRPVPTIVFHGDRDRTVHAANATEIVRQASAARAAATDGAATRTRTEHGTAGGRSYTRLVHESADGTAAIEAWTVHGGGHAWFGGSDRGTYTDARGPDASAEMLRFFLALPRTGSG